MTTPQRIEQILSFFEAHHHYKGSAGHPAVDRRIERDVEALRGDLEELLLDVQDEQNSKCAEKYMYLNQNDVEPVKIYEAIKATDHAYNPNKETA